MFAYIEFPSHPCYAKKELNRSPPLLVRRHLKIGVKWVIVPGNGSATELLTLSENQYGTLLHLYVAYVQ